jgi:hypothetical protein
VFFLEAPAEIFGQKLNEGWRFYHGSDIGRIHVLMKYGGIYVDNDAYVIRSLDKYRKFEFVINWDENQFMGTQVITAHKDARFLPLWLDSYRDYRSDKWYCSMTQNIALLESRLQDVGGETAQMSRIIDDKTEEIARLEGELARLHERQRAASFCGRRIQDSSDGHDPTEDAIAAMELVQKKMKMGTEFGDVILIRDSFPHSSAEVRLISHRVTQCTHWRELRG